jgi:hypothetical protein
VISPQNAQAADPRRFVWPAIGLALAVLLTGLFLSSRDPDNIPQLLADGTVLTLVQADYGKTNTLWEGTRFEKMARKFIPAKGIKLYGLQINRSSPVATLTNSENVLVFWIKHTGTKKWNPARARQTAIAFDERGNTLEVYSGLSVFGPRAGIYSAWVIPAFPRNGKTVGLQILSDLEHGKRRKLAEFLIRNPAPGPYPVWAAPPLPQTNRNAGVEFVLTDLELGPTGSRSVIDQGVLKSHSDSTMGARATFLVFENGHASADWTVQVVPDRVTDAAGNRTSAHQNVLPAFPTATGTNLVLGWNFPLSRGEPWKIPAEFYRFNGVPQKTVIEAHGLALSRSTFVTSIWTTNHFGSRLVATVRFGNLLVCFPDKPAALFIGSVRAVNDRGESLRPERRSFEDEFERPDHVVNFPLPANSTTVDLTIEVYRKQVVEFVAKPRWVGGTNNPAKTSKGSTH